ncbi:MAG TPA: pantoate--beta-alanine ligase [Gammaproteobacteria bacterium]|nr:pantoate--beta-alanine ligase [Gammaproteobacteria bacterium]
MLIVESVEALQEYREKIGSKTVGFVPTMGNFHLGHLSLMEKARKHHDVVIVSIFVNPTQFDDSGDFLHYPRTLEQDIQHATSKNVDMVFCPTFEALYPDAFTVHVEESLISTTLEGKMRPGHFKGVLTIVLKLLNLIKPHVLYLGEKDYQQYRVIKKMIDAFFLNTKISLEATVRAHDGLALSSRNSKLTSAQRQIAPHFFQILSSIQDKEKAKHALTQQGFRVDYLEDYHEKRLAAVRLGDIRLLDNIDLSSIANLVECNEDA